MSRRKQGRPQQRLTLDSVEKENDLLVCGDCQTNFPLRDITKFIRHKVNKCNKENVEEKDRDTFEKDGGDESNSVIGAKCTSISAPIAWREPNDGSNKSPRGAEVDIKPDNGDCEDIDTKDVKDRQPFKVKRVDTGSNTTNSEPVTFTCDNCRKLFGSAWTLLQHAQKDHGLRIYVTSSRDSYPDLTHRSTPTLQKSRRDDLSREAEKHSRDERIKREKDEGLVKERLRSDSTDPLRATSSVSSGSSTEGLSGQPSPHNPFMFPRVPMPDGRHPLSPIPGLSPFARAPDIRFDMPPDLYRHGLFGLPPGFDHSHGPSPPFHPFEQRTPRHSAMNADDFYSQRLRQLASSTSPSPGGRKHTPPFSHSPGSGASPASSMFATRPLQKTGSVSSEIDRQDESQGSPGNHKSCEFCGKTFRFQSNLIVHRRSHTGEKPYKCPVCPHACTQQSKLKRHMKTHIKQGDVLTSEFVNAADGSHPSSSGTPDSSKNVDDDDDDADDDEVEEEEEEEMDMMDLTSLKKETSFPDENKDKEQSQPKPFHGGSELAARLFDDRITQTITKELAKDSEQENQKQSSGSVLSEVFENTGLQNFPHYNEALKLAMAEKIPNTSNEERPKSNPQPSTSPSTDKPDTGDKEKSHKRERPADDSGILSITKMIKKEPHEKLSTPPTSTNTRPNPTGLDPAFFPSLWFSGTADIFKRHAIMRGGYSENGSDMINGFGTSPLSSSENAANNNNTTLTSSNATTPTTPQPTNGSSSSARKDRSRNDTCEYCGKIFKNCSNLTVHRRSHTGEKPYKCLLCSYACAQSSKLTRHMKTHGRFGKDVYKCKFCNMPFSVPSTLEKHMRKCVENVNKVPVGENDDTGSNSDNASASDSQSALSSASMSLPSTPMMTAASLGLPMTFSLSKQLFGRTEKTDGDDTGSNSDATSVSEALTPVLTPSAPSMVPALSFPSPSLTLASALSLGLAPNLNAPSPNI